MPTTGQFCPKGDLQEWGGEDQNWHHKADVQDPLSPHPSWHPALAASLLSLEVPPTSALWMPERGGVEVVPGGSAQKDKGIRRQALPGDQSLALG